MLFPNFDKGPKKVILQKVPLKMTWWQNTHFSLLLELLYAVVKFQTYGWSDEDTWSYWSVARQKQRARWKDHSWESVLVFSILFEGMDILAGLMENLFDPWFHNGYKDVIYGVSNHKSFNTKAYRWGESWLIYFNCLNDVLWLLVLCYLCLPRGALVWSSMCNCGISWSYSLTFVAFGKALQQANRLENRVQLFNAESHAIAVKPVHGIDDAIAKFVFDKCVKKWICIFPW